MNRPIEIYIRPECEPIASIKDEDLRVYYNGQWIDFLDGIIRISQDHDHAHAAKENV